MDEYRAQLIIPPKLKRALRNPGEGISQEVGRGIAKSLVIVQREARSRAPYRTGRLVRSITTQLLTPMSGVVGSNLKYARIQELGGVITPKRARALRWINRETGEILFAKRVKIPGKRYFRGGIEAGMEQIQDVLQKTLDDIGRVWGFK